MSAYLYVFVLNSNRVIQYKIINILCCFYRQRVDIILQYRSRAAVVHSSALVSAGKRMKHDGAEPGTQKSRVG